jgi:hypothetical protein
MRMQLSCSAPNLVKVSMMCSKSLCVLLAAVVVKAKKALITYTAKCCNVCHILLYFELFIPQSGQE